MTSTALEPWPAWFFVGVGHQISGLLVVPGESSRSPENREHPVLELRLGRAWQDGWWPDAQMFGERFLGKPQPLGDPITSKNWQENDVWLDWWYLVMFGDTPSSSNFGTIEPVRKLCCDISTCAGAFQKIPIIYPKSIRKSSARPMKYTHMWHVYMYGYTIILKWIETELFKHTTIVVSSFWNLHTSCTSGQLWIDDPRYICTYTVYTLS